MEDELQSLIKERQSLIMLRLKEGKLDAKQENRISEIESKIEDIEAIEYRLFFSHLQDRVKQSRVLRRRAQAVLEETERLVDSAKGS